MDYGKVLSRAWEITWRWKVLWILGFLASLASGASGGTNFYSFGGQDIERWSNGLQNPAITATIIAIVIALACVGFLIAIALWVASIMARGGLIAGVQQVEDTGSTSFREAWQVGRKRFWTLFGIGFLVALPIIVLVLVLAVAAALLIAAGVQWQGNVGSTGGLIIALGVMCGGALCCGLVILTAILGVIQVYADRAAILEGLGWIDAFKRGWGVLKANFGPTIVLWLIFLVIGLVFGVVVASVVAAIAVPLVAVFSQTDPGPWILVPLIVGGLIAMVIGALIQSVFQTFSSAVWTLAYRQMSAAAPGSSFPMVAQSDQALTGPPAEPMPQQ